MTQTTSTRFRQPGRHAMKQRWRSVQCWCGHYREAHAHYRYGTECGLCGCQRWAPPPWWRLRSCRLGREGLGHLTPAAAGPASTVSGRPGMPVTAAVMVWLLSVTVWLCCPYVGKIRRWIRSRYCDGACCGRGHGIVGGAQTPSAAPLPGLGPLTTWYG